MITTKDLTVQKVEADLAELETTYRSKKKKLRALLAVLKEEQPKEVSGDE